MNFLTMRDKQLFTYIKLLMMTDSVDVNDRNEVSRHYGNYYMIQYIIVHVLGHI